MHVSFPQRHACTGWRIIYASRYTAYLISISFFLATLAGVVFG